MHGLTLLILVFVIVDEWRFVRTSKLVSKDNLEKVDEVFRRYITNTIAKRAYFEDFYWEMDSFTPRLISFNAFSLMLLAVVAKEILS